MFLPVYLQGPPAASQIWLTRFVLNLASLFGSDAVALKKLLIRASPAQRPTNSSTTAVIAFLPPRLLYKASSANAEGTVESANIPAKTAVVVNMRMHIPFRSLFLRPHDKPSIRAFTSRTNYATRMDLVCK